LLCLLAAPRVFTQAPQAGPPETANVRVRVGPLLLNPTFAITNAGVDTNVFNDPTDQNPKSDFTFTLDPKTDLWLRAGQTWNTGNVDEQIVWYQKYANQRSVNNRYQLGWLVPLNRLTFKVNGSYLSTRERPGFEIDARAQRYEKDVDGSIEIRALSKTYFGVRASRLYVDYAADAVFLDANLHDELNRVVTTGGLTVRHELTPLTTVTLDVSQEQDRFQFDPLRDSDASAASASVKFDKLALIKGTATFGYEHFKPRDPRLPDFTGATAALDLSYVLLARTMFRVQATRGIQYSYDVNQPYYLQTGVSGSITQRLFDPVDVVVRGGIQHLAYRDRAGAVLVAFDRTDRTVSYGGGAGYHMGRDVRIGFNIDQDTRTSPVTNREYRGLRFGTSVTYGS
jgi:hypothetical protein